MIDRSYYIPHRKVLRSEERAAEPPQFTQVRVELPLIVGLKQQSCRPFGSCGAVRNTGGNQQNISTYTKNHILKKILNILLHLSAHGHQNGVMPQASPPASPEAHKPWESWEDMEKTRGVWSEPFKTSETTINHRYINWGRRGNEFHCSKGL